MAFDEGWRGETFVLALKRDLETIRLLRADLERKNDELEKLRALYDAVTVQHKSLLAERDREKTRLASADHPLIRIGEDICPNSSPRP